MNVTAVYPVANIKLFYCYFERSRNSYLLLWQRMETFKTQNVYEEIWNLFPMNYPIYFLADKKTQIFRHF